MRFRTATVFSLALFPQVFLFERVRNADVVFVLTDRLLDDKNHVNQCVIRSAAGFTRKIEIPVRKKGVPIDDVDVPERSTWFPSMQQELQRAYSGLPMASAACELVAESMLGTTSPWLTDYLMHAFVMTVRWLGWEKETVRGATVQRRSYAADSQYLLDLCVQNGCERLIVGTGPESKDRKLFRSEGVTLVSQHWHGSTTLPGRDSILDAVARFSAADVLEKITTGN